MNIDLNDITFIIVSYKSKKVIYNCINSLPKPSKVIVIENSSDKELKNDLEMKYDNIEVILNDNIGMGASNNIGIKISKTNFAYVLNPDVVFKETTFLNLIRAIKAINDFSVISPINENKDFPNYKINSSYTQVSENVIEVDTVDGFSMLINKSKFKNEEYFDENFFLYLENDDLCKRLDENDKDIYIVPKSKIHHLGGKAVDPKYKSEIEYIRNWHWMWSKFYFNKKHYGYMVAIKKTFHNLISAIIKYIFYSMLFNKRKKNIYKMRFFGLFNAIIGKKSFLRPGN